jgi:1-acyl-sn-glycerol-3-phosphate acyltransferase
MKTVYAFLIVGWRLFLYELYRFGIGPRGGLRDLYVELRTVLSVLLGWKRNLRFRGGENCPAHGPAIFVANHVRVDDPLVLSHNVSAANHFGIQIWFLMRDDFFTQPSTKNFFYDLDELTEMTGTFRISRDGAKLSQLRPFIKLLREGESFVIYPMGTRTRTGVLMEFRPGDVEPGSASFFAQQAQLKQEKAGIPIAPVVRTYDLTNGHSVTVFGPQRWPDPGMTRDERIAFDNETIASMGDLVEINAAHLVSGILYLRALHGLGDSLRLSDLVEEVVRVHRRIGAARLFEPNLISDSAGEVKRVIMYFEKVGLLERKDNTLMLVREQILAAPGYDMQYKRNNPLKYTLNAIIHLQDVVNALEAEVLPLLQESRSEK